MHPAPHLRSWLGSRVRAAAFPAFFCVALAACGGQTLPPVVQPAPESRTTTPQVGIYPEVQEAPPSEGLDAETALVVPPGPATPTLRPVNVAILLPLSGANAGVGNALLNAAQMALFDVGGQNLVLWPKDTEGTPEGAARAVEAALQDGVELILGPLFSGSVRAAAETARERGVNVVAFSNDRSVAGDGVFLMGFMPEQQVDRVVNFARTQGITRFAALLPETPFGATVEDALRAAMIRGGGDLVRVERYFPDAQDFQDPVQRIAALDAIGELGYEALFIAEGGARMRAIAPFLPYYDVDPDNVRFLGTLLWEDPAIGREPAMVGGWFAGPSPEAAASFRARYAALYGAATPRVASLAYDAMGLAAVLSRAAERPYFTEESLRNQNGFVGIDGIFRFDEDGIAQRGLAVIEIRPRDFQVISNAPQSFEEAIN